MTTLLKELTVADLLKTKKRGGSVHTSPPTLSILDAAIKMKELNVGLLVVTEAAGQVVGVISERDIVRRAVVAGLDLQAKSIASIMTSKPIFTSTLETIEDCLMKFKTHHCRHLPVGSPENPLVDLLSERDLMTFLMEKFQDHNALLLSDLSFSGEKAE